MAGSSREDAGVAQGTVGGRRSRRRAFLRAAVLLTVVAVVLIGLLAAGQRALMYFPDRSAAGSAADVVPGGQDVVLTTDDGLELDAWLLPPSGVDGGADRDTAVLYLPGNGGNRAGRAGTGRALAERGFTVLLLDYRGYGGNPGSPSEDGLARDARAGAAFLREAGFDPSRTLYLGESIGTGVAAGLTATEPPAGVMLRSPFPSMVHVARTHYPWLPVGLVLRDRFEAAEHLAGSDVPVLVAYGDADTIVPPEASAELAERVGVLHGEVVVPGAGHNDAVWFGPFLADTLAAFADDVVGG